MTKTETEWKRLLKKWAVRIVVALLCLLCVASLAGGTYEFLSERRDAHRFPMQGKLVDVGGYRLNMTCTGRGSMPVIFESGMGVPGLGWKLVQREVEKFTTACSYDRAGYGWSDPGPIPRTSLQIAKELHSLIHNAGISSPYILVGHSFGGFTVRMFHSLYPDEVAGVVLVASELEDEHTILASHHFITPADDIRQRRIDVNLARFYPLLHHLGIARLFLLNQHSGLPEELESSIYSLILKPNHIPTMLREDLSDLDSAAQVRQTGTLGTTPLIVLTTSPRDRDSDVSQKDWDVYLSEIATLQHKLTALSTQGRQLTVESGHDIQLEKPEAVVNAIRQVEEVAEKGNR